MTDDLLARATDALRRTTAPLADGAQGEIEHIIGAVRGRSRRRRRLLLVALQIALVTLGAGAWAATSGRLTEIWTQFTAAKASAKASLTSPRPARPAPAHPSASAAAGDPAAADQPRAVPEPVPLPAPELAVSVSSPVSSLVPSLVPPSRARGMGRGSAAPMGAPRATALYRVAHEAHFVRRDWAAAVLAWDRYLAADQAGLLVPEARYNRALALVRLGRVAEAAAALQLFVDGEYGSYRQDDARRLLEYLRQRPQ